MNTGQFAHKSGVRFQRGADSSILGGQLDSDKSVAFGNASITSPSTPASNPSAKVTDASGIFVTGLLGPSTPSSLDNCKWTLTFNDVRRLEPMDLQYYTRTQVERYHTGYGLYLVLILLLYIHLLSNLKIINQVELVISQE